MGILKKTLKMNLIGFMKGVIVTITVSVMICSCHHSGGNSVNSADSANKAARDSGTAVLSKKATKFMTEAADAGMTEIALGQLAERKSDNEKVQNLASMIVQDYTAANARLKAIADKKHVTLPDSLSGSSKQEIRRLAEKNRTDFNKAYIKMMVNDHQKDIKNFRNESFKIKDADLHQWISLTLGTLRRHLDSAKSIRESIKG